MSDTGSARPTNPPELDGSAGPWQADSYASRWEGRTAAEADPSTIPEPARFTPGMELGRGGMGHVRLVRDRHLVRDLAWKEGAAHVLREARITAQLEHPGILPIHDLGATPDGQSYFAMRAVRGRTLAALLKDLHRDGPPPSSELLPLLRSLLQAAQAVAWAHHRGVVHRDLKPSNIMVGPFGEVLVIDWGLALVLDEAEAPLSQEARDAIATLPIEADALVGTPRYMPPEQGHAPLDRRADVWALGCILFETLTGRPPRDDRNGPLRSLAELAPATPLELQAIVTRALTLDPARRYPDARALADELSAFLDGRRVEAYAYRTLDHVRRFVRAFRLPIAVGLAALLALFVLGVVALDRIADERDHALSSEAAAHRARAAADQALAISLVGEARRLARLGLRPEAESAALRALALVEHPEARGVLASFAASPGPRMLSSAPLPPCQSYELADADRVLCHDRESLRLYELRGEEAALEVWSHATRAPLAALVDGGRRVITGGRYAPLMVHEVASRDSIALDPRRCVAAERLMVSGRYALVTNPECATFVDTVSGQTRALEGCPRLHAATIAHDGAWAVLCAGGDLIRAADLHATPTRLPIADHARPENQPAALSLLPSGAFVVIDTRGRLELRAPSGERLHRIDAMTGMTHLLTSSPDGRWVAVGGDTGSVYLYDLPGLGLHATLPADDRERLVWLEGSPGPARFVTLGRLAALPFVRSWELREGPGVRHVIGEGVVALAVDDSDGRLLVGHEAKATLLELATGSARVSLGGAPGGGVKGVFFDRLGHAHVGTSLGQLTRHAADAPDTVESLPFPGQNARRYASVGDWIVAAPYGQPLQAARSDAPDEHLTLDDGTPEDPSSYWLDLDESPGGGRFVAAIRSGIVRSVELPERGLPTIRVIGHDPDAVAIAAFVHGRWVALASADRVSLHETEDFAPVASLVAPDADLLEIATDPTGQLVAAGARDGAVFVWDLHRPGSDPLITWRGHAARVPTLVFDGAGRLATGSWDGSVGLLDVGAVRREVDALTREHHTRWGRAPHQTF